MIELKPFGAGLGVIGLQINKPVTAELMRAYWLAFRNETDQREWEAFTANAVARNGWEFLPTVPQLLEALREFRGAPALLPEAVAAYDRVVACREYSAEGGTSWTFRRVLEQCGRAAAEAFQSAGGHSAFATTWNEAQRRTTFLEHYQLAARQDPQTRALPAPPVVRAITGEVSTSASVDSTAAVHVMRDVRARLGIRETPKAPAGDTRIVLTDERLAALRRQAAAIQEQPELLPAE